MAAGLFDNVLPETDGVGVMAVQFDHFAAGNLFKSRVLLGFLLGVLIEAFEVGYRHFLRIAESIGNLRFQIGGEHSELGSPVADVVLANDAVAFELMDAGNPVADDGASQVADMHFFGNVWAGIIHDNGFRHSHRFDSQPLGVLEHSEQALLEQRGLQPKIDKARAGDFRFFAQVVYLKAAENLFGQLPWIGFDLPGGGHDAVDLIVAEGRISGDGYHCRHVRAAGCLVKGLGNTVF